MKKLFKIFALILVASILFGYSSCSMGGGGETEEGGESSTLTISGIKIDTTSVKLTYDIDEEFSSNGIKVYVVYSDKSEKEVKNFSVVSDEFNNKTEGKYKITVKYSNDGTQYTETYSVEVKSSVAKPTSMTVDTSKIKTSYVVGEELDLKDLVVTINYSDGSKQTTTNYTVDSSAYNKNAIGYYKVVITYNDGTNKFVKSLYFTVKDILSSVNYLIGIEVTPREKEFLVGTDYSTTDLQVIAVYLDGSKADVTAKAKVNSSKYNKDVVGCYEIIIEYSETYGEGVAEQTVTWDSFYFAFVVNSYGDSYEE